MRAATKEHGEDEMRVYVEWSATIHGAQGSSLGGIRVPRQMHATGFCAASDRLPWLIDFERAIATIAGKKRRLLCLLGMGHSQLCAAREIGISLRTCATLATHIHGDLHQARAAASGTTRAQAGSRAADVEPPATCACGRPGPKPQR